MRFLVICRPAAGGDQDEFKRLVPAETAALREEKAKGTLTGAWSPGRPGAVLMLDVPDADEAAHVVAAFPLVQAALITTEIIPLHPIDL
jgi:muconolactone delta-isomerase